MSDETRDLENLTNYLMRARHDQLVMFAEALQHEVIARGLRGDADAAMLKVSLRGQTSMPRAEPLARP